MTLLERTSEIARSTSRIRSLLMAARAVGSAMLGLMAVAAFTPLPNVAARYLVTPDSPMPAGAIVALASTINGDGTLSDMSISRFVRAAELYAEGLAPLLVLSGSEVEDGGDEAEVRTLLARRFGVPPSAIVTVSGHYTTRDEALAIATALRARGISHALVVTGWAHTARVRDVFRRLGLDVRVVATSDAVDASRTPQARLWLAWECARELSARLYYRLAGFA